VGFHTPDYIILILYLLGVAFLGIVRGGKQASTRDYFLGRDALPWWAVCFSIVAAETSTLTFISIPGLAYITNLNFLQLTFGYLLGRIVISFIFLPAYYSGELSTAYAFLERRFGEKTRSFASLVFLITRLASEGVRLFAASIPLKFILNINYPTAILIIAAVALLYTYLGGVRGMVWVDAFQMFIYLGGALLSVVLLISSAGGGWTGIAQKAMEAGKFAVFNLGFRENFWGTPYTLPAGLLGGAFLSMASHGTDQLIVQRVLTTKSLAASRKAMIGSGIIIIFQFALFLLVGILLYGHYDGATVAQLGLARADEIFPRFITTELPSGAAGFVIAGLTAVALSSLAGSMSSMASSTVLDLFKLHPRNSVNPDQDLRLSRVVTVGWSVMLVGSALFFMNTTQTVVELALTIASFTYGGLLGTFLLGVLFKKPSQKDALGGFIASIGVMITVITLNLVAWTWFIVVGVCATLIAGNVRSLLGRKSTE